MLTALLLQVAELGGWAALWFLTRRDKVRQYLIHGADKSVKTPILDSQLGKYIGHPSKFQRGLANRIVTVLRKIVNTRAFELAVIGMCNTKSPVHRTLLKKKTPIQVHVI